MTLPLSILAAALERVQQDPALASLPASAQAERAAVLVLAGQVTADGRAPASALCFYLEQLDRARSDLRDALDRVADGDGLCLSGSESSVAFERALDTYHQAAANVAELMRRTLECSANRNELTGWPVGK